MAEVTGQMVKELRERTGAGIKDCKDILTQTNGDINEAIKLLREKGLKVSEKVADREANEGRIEVYMHSGNRLASIVEVNCETDFVGRNDDFIKLCGALAMQVAAMNPRYIRPEDVPEDAITASGEKPEKFYEQFVLIKQPFVRNPSQTVEDLIKDTVAKVRENIVIRRFVRYEIGG